tara:strand:- start:211 stop:330 length:120 start_codon:yes stop_codon:yes gene_type:complete
MISHMMMKTKRKSTSVQRHVSTSAMSASAVRDCLRGISG